MTGALLGIGQAGVGEAHQRSVRLLDQVYLERPCACGAASRWAMPARAALTARSAASQASAGAPVTGNIASTPSPMNFSTSPPKACTAPATRSNPAVNLVSRLEGLCRPLGRSVLISGAVAAETTTSLVPLGEHVLRGIAAPCTIFTLPDRVAQREMARDQPSGRVDLPLA